MTTAETGGAPRQQLGLLFGLATQVPRWIPEQPLARGLLGLLGLLLVMRAVDLYRFEIGGGALGRHRMVVDFHADGFGESSTSRPAPAL